MENQENFDMESYIRKRMMEISQLEERVLYKEIVGKLLLELYEYNQNSYRELEERILNESKSEQSDYAIYLTMTDREHYDATDEFMYPMKEEDIHKKEIPYEDVEKALKKHEDYRLYSVFLQTSASEIYELLRSERKFYGLIKTSTREYKGTFQIRRNEVYLDMIKDLYYIFAANYQPWLTVCEAYLTKMLDVYLCSAEKLPKNDVIKEIQIDFEEYSSRVRYEMFPLWNLKRTKEKTSTYPEPSIDKTNYEHQIFSHRLNWGCEYLVMDTDVEITNIRRVNGDLIISCPLDKPCDWNLYQVNKWNGQEHYLYPVLSNQYKESFSGSITEMFRKSIKTKAEIARLIEAFPYEEYLKFRGMEITEEVPDGWENSNYSMDGFILDEIRIGKLKQVLNIVFAPVDEENYLNEDVMSFLVTQVQKIFPEYLCLGRLIKEA